MADNKYQALQSALHLPSHEEALNVFTAVEDLNVRSAAGKVNILHHYITENSRDSGKHLRIKDFYTLIQMGADVNAHAHDGQKFRCDAPFELVSYYFYKYCATLLLFVAFGIDFNC